LKSKKNAAGTAFAESVCSMMAILRTKFLKEREKPAGQRIKTKGNTYEPYFGIFFISNVGLSLLLTLLLYSMPGSMF
jgi:hypothetical protein